MHEVDKKQYLENFLKIISNISDEKYQRRVWIEGRGPEWDDFDDTVEYFFLFGDIILKEYKEYGINDSQYNLLKKFRDEFETFSKNRYSPDEIIFISTPEWKQIMEMAEEVLKAFNYKK